MLKRLMVAAVLSAAGVLAGCQEEDAQRAGEEVGEAAEETREAAEDFGEGVRRGADEERRENQ